MRFPDCFSCPDLTQHKLTTVKGSIYFSKIMRQENKFSPCAKPSNRLSLWWLNVRRMMYRVLYKFLWAKSLRAKRARAFQNPPCGSGSEKEVGWMRFTTSLFAMWSARFFQKFLRIVMVHVHHYPHEGSDLDDIAVLGGGGAGVTAR